MALKGQTVPRIFTPPLKPLFPRSPATEARTFGYSVIDFAEQVCDVALYEWQKWLLVSALERGADGSPRFRTIVVEVARQQGKSTLSQVLALWSMYVYPHLLPSTSRKMTVLGTAQDLDTAESVWEGAMDIIDESPDLAALADRPVKVNGKKAIRLLTGEQYKVKAANRKAGRGLSGDLIMLDELREHQTWDAWAAVTKTTIARPQAQVWAFSNAGDISSVVLRHLRMMAHKTLGDPDGICQTVQVAAAAPTDLDIDQDDDVSLEDIEQDENTLALFEWSAPPGCNVWDRAAWAQANPSLGYGLVTERTLAAACRTDPEWVFRTEVLCQWSDGTLEGPFPPGTWDKGKNSIETAPDGSVVIADEDRIVGQVVAGIHQSHDRSRTFVAFGGHRADGQAQVEIVAVRLGSDWVKDWLLDDKRRHRITSVAGQSNGSAVSPLMEALDEDPEFTLPVKKWAGGDLTAGWAMVFDDVRDNKIRHNPQPVLDVAAATAVVKIFSGGASIPDDRASPADVAPLMAFTAARWLLSIREAVPPPPPPPPAAVTTASSAPADDITRMGF